MVLKKHLDKSKGLAEKVFEDVGSKVGGIAEDASKLYQESGAKEKINNVAEATSNHLDILSGQKMYDLVQEKLELQNKINDVLAYKLQEAINKIEELENKVESLLNS